MANQPIIPFTAVEMTALEAKVAEMKESIPFAVGLSNEDRKRLFPIGRKSTQFVQHSVEAFQLSPGIAPSFVNTVALDDSYLAYNQLGNILGSVTQLQRMISDTMVVAGCNAYSSARDFYNSAKRAAKSGVPGAQVIVDTLKPRFQKTRTLKAPAPTTAVPPADQPAG